MNSVKFMTQGIMPREKDALYLTTLSKLLTMTDMDRPLNVLCIKDRSIPENMDRFSKLNMIFTSGQIFELFNKINDLILTDIKTQNASSRLLNGLIEGKGLQHIVDIGFELLGNPILVSDLSHKILANTKSMDFGDPVWNDLIKKGYRSYSLVITGNSKGLFERIRRSGIPFIIPASSDGDANSKNQYSKIYSNIVIANKTVGYITVVGVWKPFDVTDIETVSLFSRVISQEMQKDRFFRNSRGMMFEYFISDLLENKLTDQKIMEERMKYLNLELKGNIYVLIIRAGKSVPDSFILDSMQKFNLEAFGRAIIYNDDILLVVTRNTEITKPEDNLEGLGRMMAENGMVVGLSRCFHSMLDIKEAYVQSMKAIELGLLMDEKKIFHRYDDYAVYHFIASHSAADTLGSFCHPAIKLLEEHDKRHESDYVKSLYTFLSNDKKLIETSNVLHVHRNTLSSRMEKISEIMQLDLEDPEISFHLLLSFKIMQLEKMVKGQEQRVIKEIGKAQEEAVRHLKKAGGNR
ncbi:MAG: hypothetical protein HGA22_14875, partial [Clostridiales bacterium]|nr:hypothetical protein [Clostridiales bacterium]